MILHLVFLISFEIDLSSFSLCVSLSRSFACSIHSTLIGKSFNGRWNIIIRTWAQRVCVCGVRQVVSCLFEHSFPLSSIDHVYYNSVVSSLLFSLSFLGHQLKVRMKWDTPAVENSCFTLLIYLPCLLARFFLRKSLMFWSDRRWSLFFTEKTVPMDVLDVQQQLADQRRGRYVRVSDVDRRQLIEAYKKNEDFIALAKKLNIKRSTGKRKVNLVIVSHLKRNGETLVTCQRCSYSYYKIEKERTREKNVRYTRLMLYERCTRSTASLMSGDSKENSRW